MTKTYTFNSQGGYSQDIHVHGVEFTLLSCRYGCVVKVDDGTEFDMYPGMTYRHFVDNKLTFFKKLTFRSKESITAIGEILVSNNLIIDNRAWGVISGDLNIYALSITETNYSHKLQLNNYSGQRVELRAHHANAHSIFMSVQQVGNGNYGGAFTYGEIIPGEAPVIITAKKDLYFAKGSSLGYGANSDPILQIINHQ